VATRGGLLSDTVQDGVQGDEDGTADAQAWVQARREALEPALRLVLMEHGLEIEERRRQRTALYWPDESDIYAATVRAVRALCDGRLDPRRYIAAFDEQFTSPLGTCPLDPQVPGYCYDEEGREWHPHPAAEA
jgi:hypothetical protein